ncbi:MAG: ATP-binding protein, partial [Aggregatilineales bacterium]
YADIADAYDRVMSRPLAGIALNMDDHPTLMNVIERREQRTLYKDRNINELRDIYTRLDIDRMGPVYFQPLVRRQEVIAVLMIGMPYAGRELSRSDTELLKGFGIIASNLLAISYSAQEAQLMAEDRAIQSIIEGMSPDEAENVKALSARQDTQQHLKLAREQIAGLSRQVMGLKLQLDDERTRMTSLLGGTERELSISQRIEAINDEHIRLREDRDRLSKRLQEAEAALNGATADSDEVVVNNMVRALQREKETLSTERDYLQQQLAVLREQGTGVAGDSLDTVLHQVTQDKDRVSRERDQLADRLDEIETQLEAMGIDEGVTGLSQLIGELYHERALQKEHLQKIQTERDTLLAERNQIGEHLATVKAYDEQTQMLEMKIQNLASDREAATRQRDRLRGENEELSEKINIVKEHRARALAQASGMEIQIEELHQEQAKLRASVQEMVDERSYLENIYEKLLADKQQLEISYQQVLARLDGEQSRLQELSEEGTQALQRMVNELTDERHQLELQLSQVAHQLRQADDELSKLSRSVDTGQPDMSDYDYQLQHPDLLVGLVQELRSPMTSMIGYVDLLLGESAGILGEMQKKFLQRVSSSISRLDAMIDDLVRVTHLDTGQFQLDPRPVDVINLIEEAITSASVQFREKGLGIRMELDDDLPLLHADKDSLNQIIGQLLTNAYLVSPPDTEIAVIAQSREVTLPSQPEIPQPVIYIGIADEGGGIQPEDIPRVFARKYKAENPLIQGLGDTGVGMSIARTLTEAHSGKLWLDTKDGQGTVFQVALPVNPIVTAESPAQ